MVLMGGRADRRRNPSQRQGRARPGLGKLTFSPAMGAAGAPIYVMGLGKFTQPGTRSHWILCEACRGWGAGFIYLLGRFPGIQFGSKYEKQDRVLSLSAAKSDKIERKSMKSDQRLSYSNCTPVKWPREYQPRYIFLIFP